jgi:hypothetical protein
VYTTTAPGLELDNAIAFCRVHSRITGRRLVSLPFSDHCEPLADAGELGELLSEVKRDAGRNRCTYVEIKPLVFPSQMIDASGLRASHNALIHRLNLSRSPSEVFKGFHKDCVRRKILRSEREQLRYQEGRSEELLQQFYRLLLLTRRRHQLPPQPLLWFRNLVSCLGNKVRIRIASKGGVPVAGILTLHFKNIVTYKYGCSDPQFNALGGTALLMWKTIEDAIKDGAVELDLGRSDYDTPGLITFKDHWGAPRAALTYYRYPDPESRIPTHGLLATAARRLVGIVPDPLFAAIGGLIYPHVG